jgi:hypothetical protein
MRWYSTSSELRRIRLRSKKAPGIELQRLKEEFVKGETGRVCYKPPRAELQVDGGRKTSGM